MTQLFSLTGNHGLPLHVNQAREREKRMSRRSETVECHVPSQMQAKIFTHRTNSNVYLWQSLDCLTWAIQGLLLSPVFPHASVCHLNQQSLEMPNTHSQTGWSPVLKWRLGTFPHFRGCRFGQHSNLWIAMALGRGRGGNKSKHASALLFMAIQGLLEELSVVWNRALVPRCLPQLLT